MKKRRCIILCIAVFIFILAAVDVTFAGQSQSKKRGIDVSAFNGEITWSKVKKDGFDFAFIRTGGRFGGNGKFYDDLYYEDNMKNAIANNIDVGVYFFTQAITTDEAVAEARYTCNRLKNYNVKLPVVIDTEYCQDCRHNDISSKQRTKVVKAFCDEVKRRGYEPMIYSNLNWLNNRLNMSELKDYKVWVAQYNDTCQYQGKYSCWQYTSSGKVKGIKGNVDLDIWYGPYKGNAKDNRIASVALNSDYFIKCSDAYKYRSRGKQVFAKPIVKNSKGSVLQEGKDYKVTYSSEERVNPGKYTITVKGIGKYCGRKELTLIITPEAVTGVGVRHRIAEGGYDDAFVTWNEAAGAEGYQLYARRPSATEEWTYLGKTSKTKFLKKDLRDGWRYEFKVLPYIVSDGIRYRTTTRYDIVTMRALKKVSLSSVEKYNSSKVRVEWKNIYDESGYQISQSTSKKKTDIVSTYETRKGTYKTLKAEKNKTYYYKVRAYRDVSRHGKIHKVYGPWSSVKSYKLK